MTRAGFQFDIVARDRQTAARSAVFRTPRGDVHTPAFMPVGTQATVKTLTAHEVATSGAEMLLANTYHLSLRPGEETVAELGGLHQFMGWPRPILTDSGGFQIFSLAEMARIDEQQAVFRSHIDGSTVRLSPERAVAIQEALGSDVAMVLDHVVALPNAADVIRDATQRSVRWAERCRAAASGKVPQLQFAIVQGGLDPQLRQWCADQLVALDFPGYAIGGLSVGESPAEMYTVLDAVCPALPQDRPRYLMGVGRPEDLVEAVARGVDLFDCVMPTRNGRNAVAFTDAGKLRLRNARFARDPDPIDPECPCLACRHSKAYLRHLFMAGEMLALRLLSHHNLTYYQRLLAEARSAIAQGEFASFRAGKLAGWQTAGGGEPTQSPGG
ncbi:MAG: tRNA guanosine(34) transglycosylase Tgt [Planctomycetales bacterium]|nr:tRNA guanosine(34) transglycosylase Tgt [Planctomycetales bacterium]